MSFTEKRLCNPTQLTTSGQTLYTVPASKTAIVKQIVVTNVTGSSATFSLYIGSAATPNALFSATSVAANDAIVINLSQVLNSTEILTALASANSTLNITISGVENDGPLNPLSTYIADGAITTAKLADSSVTAAKLGPLVGSNNQILALDSTTQSGLKWSEAGYRYVQRIYYTIPGTSTFTKATYPWLRAIKVICQGAGGGGGGAGNNNSRGAGGGGGAYSEKFITNISGLSASITVTVGAGGAGGAAGNNNGITGGSSSFGSEVVCAGGQGGVSGAGGYDVGAGGTVTTAGDFNLNGEDGDIRILTASFTIYSLAGGGDSFLGYGGPAWMYGAEQAGRAGSGYGGGGGGGWRISSSQNGGNGANGIVIVELYA